MPEHTDQSMHPMDELRREHRRFVADRDWARFHDPKSLILALVGEVGELAELFQWVPAQEARAAFQEPGRRQRAGEEMADVFIYLLGLSDTLGIDLVAAAREKLAAAQERFPVEEYRSTAPVKG